MDIVSKTRAVRPAIALAWSALLLLTLGVGIATAQDAVTPDEILREAAANNPALRSAYAAWQAERARTDAAGKLPDPRLTYSSFVQPVETRIGAQRHQVGIQQTIPWFGSLGREQATVEASSEAARSRVALTWLEVEFKVTKTLHEIHRLDGLREIERESLALLQQFESVARARLRANTTTNADVLRLQVELGRAEDRLRRLDDERLPTVEQLNALLDRLPGTRLQETPPLRELPVSPEARDERLQTSHPRLEWLRALALRSGRRADVARDRGRPDITVGVVHTFVEPRDVEGLQGDGDDATLATVSINVPLWRGKIDADVRAAQTERASYHAALRDATNDLEARLQRARFDHEDAGRRVELYEGTLVPKAEESLRATLDAYAAERADFGELIDVQRTLLEFQRSLLEARVARADARAMIESLVPDPASIQNALASVEVSR